MIRTKLHKGEKYILKKIPGDRYAICEPSFWYLGEKIVDPVCCGGSLEYCKSAFKANGITDYTYKDVSD